MPLLLTRLTVAPLPYRLRYVFLQGLVLHQRYLREFEFVHHPSLRMARKNRSACIHSKHWCPTGCRVRPATASASSCLALLGFTASATAFTTGWSSGSFAAISENVGPISGYG